ncbi:tRNA (guanosine(37)-N1)-methyltransferase TrmD [Alcaligenes endophyticus]|uniref:tRNA (guanine-N(1)-)-methyltransferase n=1 Tax=Alcaligenes endophyticus TaxID=1929088 RepID=A0ABT8EIB0_9BURK|nr:tRNA (guanosine(37)-N1)-methyltransferase TrmD [Alcaligenes endophyticus]MCX5592631.1 tRNA (guanosine(37)-N1)-methyltransferase TrmD [Alcaligenes endophyticus]MDN4121021.1 tRNA (guanosine(37)-N1)-methyltransferase TrmD [Alcaligenes endophyticus]
MRFDALTLFPDMFSMLSQFGVAGRAHKQGIWSMHTCNPRDFTHDVHRTVDDRPYGGGPGMVMLAEPLEQALNQVQAERQDEAPVILLSPVGRRFDQSLAQDMANKGLGAIFVCGRYEGIDQRFIDKRVDDEISMGDFVLSGGEIPALAIMDAVVRLLPGVLNTAESAIQDSFHSGNSGLLDSPHYTRPESYLGVAVPDVLMSGHHLRIAQWRREQSLRLTLKRRPELIERARAAGQLSKADERFLASL